MAETTASRAGPQPEELAQQIGCALVTLRKIETRARRPSKPILERLTVIFSLPPAQQPAFMAYPTLDLPWRRPFTRARGHRHPRPHPLANIGASRPSRQSAAPTDQLRRPRAGDGRGQAPAARNAAADADGRGRRGKTRLALQAAGGLLSSTPTASGWSSSRPWRSGSRAAAIGSALGVRDERTDPCSIVGRPSCGTRMLLVLDNCEHLLAACAMADMLLHAAPDCILATSREPLASPARRYRVPSLAVPDPEHCRRWQGWRSRSGAAVRRAGAAVQPGFA